VASRGARSLVVARHTPAQCSFHIGNPRDMTVLHDDLLTQEEDETIARLVRMGILSPRQAPIASAKKMERCQPQPHQRCDGPQRRNQGAARAVRAHVLKGAKAFEQQCQQEWNSVSPVRGSQPTLSGALSIEPEPARRITWSDQSKHRVQQQQQQSRQWLQAEEKAARSKRSIAVKEFISSPVESRFN
jgi:hypothetical protein